ncbi:MAG: hypothetical protein G01um101419_666 [Parcubacteria group bacterium Gr01-1014_19]|nr:MAG: hypothetical protein G01um101419_666 [Parcubacteria group bacterium Gr01-1014_19]
MATSSVLITLVSSGKQLAVGDQQISSLDSEIKSLEEEWESCSGLEYNFAQSLHKKVEEAKADRGVLEKITKWGKPVSALDLDEALHWRDATGLPRVLIFSSLSFKMQLRFLYDRKIPSKFSKKKWESCVAEPYHCQPAQFFSGRLHCFDDLKTRLLAEGSMVKLGFKEWFRIAGETYRSFEKSFELLATFNGEVSSLMRASIKKAREIFGDGCVYVLAEAPEWKRTQDGSEASTQFTGKEFLLVAVVDKRVLLLDASGVPLAAPKQALVNGW